MSNSKSDDDLKLYKILENYLTEYLDKKQGCADRAIAAIQKEIER